MWGYKTLVVLFSIMALFMVLQAAASEVPVNSLAWLAFVALCILAFLSARRMNESPAVASLLIVGAVIVFWTAYFPAVPALKKTGANWGDLAWLSIGLGLTLVMAVGATVSSFLAIRRKRKAESDG